MKRSGVLAMLLGITLLAMGCDGTATTSDTKAKATDAKPAKTMVPGTDGPAAESNATGPVKPVEDPFVTKSPAAGAVAPPAPEQKTDRKR
jgi:hypothetical protein